MTRPAPRPPGRREVLAGAGLLALAGCLHDDEAAPGASEPPEVRLRAGVAVEVAELGALYAAVLARFPSAGRDLAPLAAEHAAHVEALRGHARTPSTSPTASPGPSTTSTTPAPDVPATLPEAVRALAAAERTAADRRARQAVRTTPGTARLLASIAACDAAHAELLEPGGGA
jgi:hypothetical protein